MKKLQIMCCCITAQKVADIIFDSEKLDEEKKCRYEEGIESFLKQMEFPEIVMSNQHISRANKVYLLRKYYPDICKKFSGSGRHDPESHI